MKKNDIKDIKVVDPQVVLPVDVLMKENPSLIPMYPFTGVKVQPNQEGYMVTHLTKVKVLQELDNGMVNIFLKTVRTYDLFLSSVYTYNPEECKRKLIPRHLSNCLKHAKFYIIEKELSINEVLDTQRLEYLSTVPKRDLTFQY